MPNTSYNQYNGTYESSVSVQSVIATDMQSAAKVLNANNNGLDPVLLQRVKENVQIEIPSDVMFTTVVSPAEAATAGCSATPETYTLAAGTQQIFTAKEVEGWTFNKWQINGTDVENSTAVMLLTIPSVNITASITAVYAAA